jgi:glycosyltransferase involved in cell wall biosynthesis
VTPPPFTAVSQLTVKAALNETSLGVARYSERLRVALNPHGIDYRLAPRPGRGGIAHLHLANSSRGVLASLAVRRAPTIVTLHDILPRDPRLGVFYRRIVHPLLARRADIIIVHSRYAATLLSQTCHHRQVELIPHPAAAPRIIDRASARAPLGIKHGAPLAVLPGVLKEAKMTHMVLEAFEPLLRAGSWRLLFAGSVVDPAVANRARKIGATVIDSPDDATFECAVSAADVVLCLRANSVGETNGPLLDAIGAHRAVIASRVGSIPEVARDAALYIDHSPASLRKALTLISDDDVRYRLENASRNRSAQLTWEASADAHARLFARLSG